MCPPTAPGKENTEAFLFIPFLVVGRTRTTGVVLSAKKGVFLPSKCLLEATFGDLSLCTLSDLRV